MKTNIIIPAMALLAIAMVCLYASCTKDYGEPTTQNYPITESYTKLEVSHAFDVTVSDNITEAIVTVPEELHGKLKLKVTNGTLHIGFTSTWINTDKECSVVLPRNAQLKDLELSGASSFRGDLQGNSSDVELSGASEYYGNIVAADVDIDLSGASTYRGMVSCDEADVNFSGASSALVEGACTGTMDIEISGASDLHASQFNTDIVKGNLSGASDADVTVCRRIAVTLSGASNLTYGTSSSSCNPTDDCTTSGGSTVTRR